MEERGHRPSPCLPACHLDQQHEDSSLLCPSGPVQTCALDGNVLTQGNPDTSPPPSWQTSSPDGFYKNPHLKTRFIRLLDPLSSSISILSSGSTSSGFPPGPCYHLLPTRLCMYPWGILCHHLCSDRWPPSA